MSFFHSTVGGLTKEPTKRTSNLTRAPKRPATGWLTRITAKQQDLQKSHELPEQQLPSRDLERSSFLLLVAMPGAPSSFLFLVGFFFNAKLILGSRLCARCGQGLHLQVISQSTNGWNMYNADKGIFRLLPSFRAHHHGLLHMPVTIPRHVNGHGTFALE